MCMDTSVELKKQPHGKRLDSAKRNVLIAKMVDKLSEGYMTTYALSKELKVNRSTIETYRPLVDELIGKQQINRNTIRNLQIKRAYKLIEMLMDDLKTCTTIKEKTLIYNQILKA